MPSPTPIASSSTASRFTDTFRTLELNESERVRFVQSARDAITGKIPVETLLAARRRGRKPAARIQVETRIDFDRSASTHSTLLQVAPRDSGLLRNLSLTLAEHACNIEVALIDPEGEMAIDVFYLTHRGAKLEPGPRRLRSAAPCSPPSPPLLDRAAVLRFCPLYPTCCGPPASIPLLAGPHTDFSPHAPVF